MKVKDRSRRRVLEVHTRYMLQSKHSMMSESVRCELVHIRDTYHPVCPNTCFHVCEYKVIRVILSLWIDDRMTKRVVARIDGVLNPKSPRKVISFGLQGGQTVSILSPAGVRRPVTTNGPIGLLRSLRGRMLRKGEESFRSSFG